MTHLNKALKMVLSNARPGCTVVIESSVSIGTTQVTLGPFQDIISCGVSAERVDPGRIAPAEHEISKIVSGLTKAALLEKQNLYSLSQGIDPQQTITAAAIEPFRFQSLV